MSQLCQWALRCEFEQLRILLIVLLKMRPVAGLRTKRFVGLALTTLISLSVFLLIYYVFTDDAIEPPDISSEDNFKQLINTENSLLLFYSLDG